MAERIAEASPLKAAGMAVGLEDHRRMLRDHAHRVRDSHKAAMRAAGLEGVAGATDDDEDMGDIIISGDHWTRNYHLPKPSTPALPAPQQPTAHNGLSRGLKAALITAAVGGPLAGILAGWAAGRGGTDTATEVVRTENLEDRILDIWSAEGQVRQRVRKPNEPPSWEK